MKITLEGMGMVVSVEKSSQCGDGVNDWIGVFRQALEGLTFSHGLTERITLVGEEDKNDRT
jgi:hypothetical protein